ncbi:MAG: ATP-binding cassette domain-containing protein [Ahniella sp.]|nr:ATP-binding cassette domain-containing protein [Ahniella sp.]
MISVRGLGKVFRGPVAALSDLALELPIGMFALLGPNGAGKSTLMRILAGLLEPTYGQIWMDGENITGRPEHMWAKLGYLPQEFGFHDELTGRQMLKYLLALKGVDAPGGIHVLCDALLARLNLMQVADRKVATYSGGMRRRLGMAQALAGNPRVLIVDEPTAGLDPEERGRLHELLAEVATRSTVILSTHLVEDAAMLCPRLAILRQGRIRFDGTPSGARRLVAGQVFEAPADGCDHDPAMFVTQRRWHEGQQWVRIHHYEGSPPRGFEVVQPTLEDAYRALLRTP